MSGQELLLKERQSVISDRLLTSGRVLAAELAEEFGVSEDTIRRDLREMAAAGLCERVYGGALPVSSARGNLKQRMAVAPDRKAVLARAAITQIAPGSTVFFDAGSTNLAVAAALPDDIALTAVTNAPMIAAALLDRPEIEVILIGGRIDRQASAAVGSRAMRDMELLSPDLCILGACGVDLDAGVTTFGFEDAEFKRLAASRSRRILIAATAEKFGTAAPYAVVPAERCDILIVESQSDEPLLEAYRKRGCHVVVASDVN
ncbi:DeoR/GlpR family DNA-binding transcription regulator [Rhizobium sp. BK251]|uniref:DeoR/GlpR family DNA-binding transcription regulator n=1 Tax=Rhizobium sp. BK251 TaxID=2512125 RepID=UPI00104D1A90|nr:DeoR/GlpR family DNA-binding transcription regulator [Rhizobium sp. BK251]TCL72903.1 DeoR family transcriptional regulator [Rhizobium sp. BK251]